MVRASDGAVVATLPTVDESAIFSPVLSPDGERIYGVWGTNASTLGFVDARTGTVTALLHRQGEISSPAVSADGSTLAYEWTPKLDGNNVDSVVIRDLASGSERVLPDAPAGPVALTLALSPNGGQLALAPHDSGLPRCPVWIVSTASAAAFSRPTVIPAGGVDCSAAEPR